MHQKHARCRLVRRGRFGGAEASGWRPARLLVLTSDTAACHCCITGENHQSGDQSFGWLLVVRRRSDASAGRGACLATRATVPRACWACTEESDRSARCQVALAGPRDPWGGGAQIDGCGLLRGRRGSRCGPQVVVCSLTLLAVSVPDAADRLPTLTAGAAGRQPRSVGRIARIGGRDRDRAAGAIPEAQSAGNPDSRAARMMSWG
jgi:hypothetical protein